MTETTHEPDEAQIDAWKGYDAAVEDAESLEHGCLPEDLPTDLLGVSDAFLDGYQDLIADGVYDDETNGVLRNRLEVGRNLGWDSEHLDAGTCCECGEADHVCQDCPTFMGD